MHIPEACDMKFLSQFVLPRATQSSIISGKSSLAACMSGVRRSASCWFTLLLVRRMGRQGQFFPRIATSRGVSPFKSNMSLSTSCAANLCRHSDK